MSPPHIAQFAEISVKTAAKMINCAESHVRRMLRDGVLSGRKITQNAWLVDAESAKHIAKTPANVGRKRGS